MKIVLFGASGMIGSRVLAEALRRGHAVTAVVRDPSKVTTTSPNLTVKQGDLTAAGTVSELIAGHDVVVSAYSPPHDQVSLVGDVARTLVSAVGSATPSPRLIVVGGAGGLETAPGVRVIDALDFPPAWKPIARAHIDSLADVYRKSAVDWTYFSPAALIQPGERTGKYRTGRDQLVADAAGHSTISAEDYAVALLDEVETPRFRRSRMTAAY